MLPVNEVWSKGKNRKEKTVWVHITLWRERAENLPSYLKKGTRVSVVGKLSGVNAYLNKEGKTVETRSSVRPTSVRPNGVLILALALFF